MELRTNSLIHKYGYVICLDKWENVVHRPLMNVMQNQPYLGDKY